MNKFIARLSLRGKFLLITIAMLVPISVLSYISARLELEKLQVARHEDAGLEWASRLNNMALNLSEYREHAIAVAGGAESERGEMMEHNGIVRQNAQELDALMKAGDEEFVQAANWAQLRTRVYDAIDGDGTDARHLREGPPLIAELHDKVQAIAEQSELILDPGADTFPLMFSSLFDLPDGISALASAASANGTATAIAAELSAAAAAVRPGARFRRRKSSCRGGSLSSVSARSVSVPGASA